MTASPVGINPDLYAAALADIRSIRDHGTQAPAYTHPNQRAAEWARMAAQLAAEGRTPTQIADALCVSEDTARALLGTPVLGLAA